MNLSAPQSQRGTSLVEVLVTMVILAIGLLALAGLQARLHVLQIESYQRAQALILLQDMASRVVNNRYAAAELRHRGAARHGCGTVPTTTATRQEADATEWCNEIMGASETASGGGAVGAMVGGRGCVEASRRRRVPADGRLAGTGSHFGAARQRHLRRGHYNGGAGSQCVNDLCRRVVTTVIRIPTLT